MSCDPVEHERTASLLNEVFAPHPATTAADLHWYYCDNPRGTASVGRLEDDDRRLGNYALIPQDFRRGAEVVRLGIGVDLAVSPTARGTGAFRRTVEDAYARGSADQVDGILGVANANSAPRMVEALGWRQMDRFGVKLVPPALWTRGTSVDVNAEWLASGDAAVLDQVAHGESTRRFVPSWDGDYLRWRLARPGKSYAVHRGETMVAISTKASMKGLPIAVILKVFALSGRPSGSKIAGLAARHYRTPFVLYWGANADVAMRGVPLPPDLMPSPLQLVLHDFHGGWSRDSFELDTFEFLDFDGF